MQQGMLFHGNYKERSGYYIEQVICHLHEALNISTLIQSWQKALERHPVLRTGFHVDTANRPCQFVYEQVNLPVAQYSWCGLSKAEQSQKLTDYLQRDRQEGFDTSVPPIMRLALIERGEADYLLIWTFHHALLDGRSISMVLHEVFSLYDGDAPNQALTLPNRRPYQDYIDWLQQQSFAEAEPFWRDMLQGFKQPLQFPAFTRKNSPDPIGPYRDGLNSSDSVEEPGAPEIFHHGWLSARLSPTLTADLQNLAQNRQLTLNTLLHGAWALLLSRYTETSDVIFGATRACRYSAIETMESMIGLFINTVPVRVEISPEMELLPWLKTIRTQWLNLREYERTPLVDIQRWSELPRGTPLFESVVIFEHADLEHQIHAQAGNWSHREFELLDQSHYPLALNVYGGEEIALKICFDRQEFEEAVVARMLAYLETLLQSFADSPQQRISELPLLTNAEQQQFSNDLNIQADANRVTCFVVGDGILPLSCLEILLRQECQVLGVYSTDRSLQQWAEEHSIPHARSRSDFRQQLLQSEYDYLLSINNVQWIIPVDVLARARKATINYHDSPLPKYAGLYATSWALLNGETQHAVTWHEVTAEIDAGRIFKQQPVSILPEDTVFDLNTRCLDAAVSSFTELIQALVAGRTNLQIQDLSQRSYFSSSDRPAAASILSFEESSKDLCNLVRALSFGPVRNQLGLPKLWLGGNAIVVGTARAVSMTCSTPGQVLNVDADGILIATADGAVQLGDLTTIEGKEIFVEQLLEVYRVEVGQVLPVLDADTRNAISRRNAEICCHEQVWVERLMQLSPFSHPYLPFEIPRPTEDFAVHRYPIGVQAQIIEPKSLLAMFAAYCARLSPELDFDLGLQTSLQRSIAPEIFAQRVPIRVQTEAEESFSTFRSKVEAAIDQAADLGSFRCTLLRRYPELRDRLQSQALPIAIAQVASPDRLDWLHLDAAIAFVAYEDGSPPEVVHAGVINECDSVAIAHQLQTLIAAGLENPEQPLAQLPLLRAEDRQQMLTDWNRTETPYLSDRCIHQLFETQAEQTPDAIAVAYGDRELAYRELNEQANQLAHYLQSKGVGPEVLVGLHMERSLELMVGLLGIHKAGGAYVPLDPDFPRDRIAFMVQDSKAPVILTQQSLVPNLDVDPTVRILPIDTLAAEIAQQPSTNPESGVQLENLSYIIYTSGSTGLPKGVMIEHRNVVNFFTGMDRVIDHERGVWLAVTSLSFDISVLELLWTLVRGFKVVLYNAKADRNRSTPNAPSLVHAKKAIDFSLFYFSSHEEGEDATAKYRLLFEGAKFADTHGFKAIWTPERHFHAFGGLFPNPAVTSAAIAAATTQIQIRAGSCVSPLHSSIRIAEDWSMVDNFSGGRVGISFAAGWQPNDFVLRPETYEDRKNIMFQQIEEVKALWRGESVSYPNAKGEPIAVKTLPRPIQSELPVWVTAAGNPETFQMAGAKGFHILTHLLGQSLDELADKIAVYRQAWMDNNHPGQGTVTLMIHTFVGDSDDAVREIVRQPMRQYLASSLDLIKLAAWAFPTFKQKTTDDSGKFSISHLSEREMNEVLDFSFERYYETSGLFGTVDTCLQMTDRIKGIDVDEVACLIDYGVDSEAVLAQLPLLREVKARASGQALLETESHGSSIADLIRRHQATHLQCTPSMAGLLIADTANREAIAQIQTMMVGGEAFTEALATQLKQVIPGQIHNMYGPTETTIWSATHTLGAVDGVVPIGRPIANTELYVLDKNRQPVPVGIAGELYIGGKGVARGYLNRPELTQERFVPNPFGSDPTARLYRTGDLVKYRADGNLEFLGRVDFQVKVRGYRIELGEIETILSRHESVREAVIVAREDTPGDKRLVAYLLAQPGQEPATATLREHLRQHLPEYMVPSHFVTLAAFPLTPNRKVDRKALPIPALAKPASDTAHVVPQSPTERILVEIWQRILHLSELGTGDNFFDLGGNSLIAVALIGEIRTVFEVDLPLIYLFRSPTVESLAKQIDTAQIEQADTDELTALLEQLERLSEAEILATLRH
jgi:natural product biosynthesis luciferase-like monooxygenase protein